MTKVGSQEWRNNVFTYPIAVLSTRCGIRAPGHSAGVVSMEDLTGSGVTWWTLDEVEYIPTRAEAAAAAYAAEQSPKATSEASYLSADTAEAAIEFNELVTGSKMTEYQRGFWRAAVRDNLAQCLAEPDWGTMVRGVDYGN